MNNNARVIASSFFLPHSSVPRLLVIVWNEPALRRTLRLFLDYYHAWLTHLSPDKGAPIPRTAQPPACGAIIQVPHVGGLQHHYERRAV
jgi:hypothetical protein